MHVTIPDYNSDSCIESAITYAVHSHYGQTDRSDVPYIFHPLRVMEAVRKAGYSLTHQIVAVLHDVVEDTEASIDEVELYFGFDVADAVAAITRLDDEKYFSEYLPRVLDNSIARVVKYFDAQDNSSRSGTLPGEEKKYAKIMSRCVDAGVLIT